MIRPFRFPILIAGGWGLAFAQTPAASSVPVIQNFQSLPRPPVPSDPLELAGGAAVAVQTPEQRAAAVALVTRARDLSNVRAAPYDLKTSFTTSGSLPSDGSWTLEDISPGRGVYRWTAQGPNYAGVNLYTETTQGLVYSNQAGGNIPLRLAQVREAIFFVEPATGPQASIRVASGYMNGAEQRCVLTVPGAGGRSFTGARNWEEAEFCVDANTGLLTTYSPAPGMYVRYDYSSAKQFHGKTIPGGFTIEEAGRTVVEARTEGVSDPPNAQDAIFNPAGMTALGVGRVMNPAIRVRSLTSLGAPRSVSSGNAAIQVVVLHGNLSAEGQLSETEILASTDPSLNESAVDRAKQWTNGGRGGTQPGATPQGQQIIFTYEFVTATH